MKPRQPADPPLDALQPATRAPMVGWCDPRVLARSAALLTVANLFRRHSDTRLIEALARPELSVAAAFAAAGRRADVFAIPGNHDWYDSLVAFSRLFCRPERGFAGLRTHRTRSYFALALPANWWVLAIDLQLGADLDEPQVRYFQDVVGRMPAEAGVILCVPEPQWLLEQRYPGHQGYEGSVLRSFLHPTQKGLRHVLTEWIGFRRATVERRTRHRLAKVLDRIHVLEGRQLVLLNIDEVIRIICNADVPKSALIERFKLTARQAEDIVEIRRRQLARLEAIKIELELKDLRDEQKKLDEIPGSAAALERTLIREIEADAKQFGDERRTLIQADKRAVAEVKVVDEPVTVVVSCKGWVRALKGHEVDAATLALKAGDALYGTFACRGVDTLVLLGSGGFGLLARARGARSTVS